LANRGDDFDGWYQRQAREIVLQRPSVLASLSWTNGIGRYVDHFPGRSKQYIKRLKKAQQAGADSIKQKNN
jgi:hypothetical protein